MPKSDLTATGVAIFVVLMTNRDAIASDDLATAIGRKTFDSGPLKPLKDRGFIDEGKTRKGRSTFKTYRLSAAGWDGCAEVLGADVTATGSAAKALLALAKTVKSGLAASGISPSDFFHPTADSAPSARGDTEALIRKAYADLARADGDWVSLADIRDRLGSLDDNTVGVALVALARADQSVKLIRWDDQKVLTDRERAASVRYGGADAHALRIESP